MERRRADAAKTELTGYRRANKRAEQYPQDAASSLNPPPRLELLSRFDDTECNDPSDNGPRGRVYVSRDYWLRDVPRERNAEVAEALVRWWTSHDFVVLSDKRPKENWISVVNKNDGFSTSIQESANGDLSLGATSPCVWPNGTPAPKPG
ncbi:hypothetical protein [Kibdelosporangium phytohabitans]|uniref:Uncharacterized protein n=1 Tax=Kibdelosporangium phytohabitans TaxID=860235 RepID=A0A0N9HXL1_9PSEU|nr:hypothetical protein [Kibdelosporangium phytohabitans]ALG06619.1 hypothetical protein AOZ06_06505 [Kibdelosporangium phytohabitans]MBE1467825.1 hypothetical protein [Kibdelosporangium phytohabitans]